MDKKILTFEERLNRSDIEIVRDRSARLTKATRTAQRHLIDGLEKEVDDLTDKIDISLDLSPDNKYSLMLGENFKPDEWVKQFQKWNVELANKRVELRIANETMATYFPDGKVKAE